MCANRREEILEAIRLQDQNNGAPMNERHIQAFLAENYGLSVSQSREIIEHYLNQREND